MSNKDSTNNSSLFEEKSEILFEPVEMNLEIAILKEVDRINDEEKRKKEVGNIKSLEKPRRTHL